MKRATAAGIAISVAWVSGFSILLYCKRGTLAALELNQWGDFFAGAVAPLAFLWLVLGYIQQGEELRLNTEALKAQHDELKRQVNETARLAAQAERQAMASESLADVSRTELARSHQRELAAAQPNLEPQGGSGTPPTYVLRVANFGATVTDLALSQRDGCTMTIEPSVRLPYGASASVSIVGAPACPYVFTLEFTDHLSNKAYKTYKMLSPYQFVEVPP